VTLRSLGEVVDGVRAADHDEPVAAAAKGSARMVPVLRRLASSPQPGEPTEFRYFYKDDVLTLDARELATIRRGLLANLKRNRAYSRVPAAVAAALWHKVKGDRALDKGETGFLDTVSSDDRFAAFVEAWWPPVEAVDLWRVLPERIGELANGAFSADELAALRASWSGGDPRIEDVPLIDELRYLIGEVRRDEDADDDLPRQMMSFERRDREDRDDRIRATSSIEDDGYAHVLVDEAQDLSPLQWRMLARRGRYASWTIVGDAAQSSWPNPAESAQARAAALEGMPLHQFRLSTNYRNSAEIYDLAAQVAQKAIDNPDLAEAVRRTGEEPQHLLVDPVELLGRVSAEAAAALEAVEGTVAVVAGRADVGRVADSLARLAAEHPRLRVLDGIATKGLEFDAVVIVEPDAITDESESGWRTLYVVLTRATQRLTTVGTTDQWRQRLG
ncbi:MAG TPA: ATP-binding domain-containing protein, partial [Aeromicrobium sp.]